MLNKGYGKSAGFSKLIVVLVLWGCVLLALASNSSAVNSPEEQRKVSSPGGHAALLDKVHKEGSVRLIVTMSPPFKAMGHLQEREAQMQRDTIAAAQKEINTALLGLDISNVTNFIHVPQIALTADLAAFETLLSHPMVLRVAEDVPVPYILDLSVPRIGAPIAWGQGITGSDTAVAILDTGVDKTHPFLSGAVVSEACYSTDYLPHAASSVCPGGVTSSTAVGSAMPYAGNCPTGECDHGTHVAGIAAGRDNGSFSGVAKGAGVIAIQVFSRFDSSYWCDGNPPCALAYTSDIIKGLQRAYELRATYNIAAVNLSLGGGKYAGYCDNDPVKPSIDNLKSVEIATVIASGNEGYTDSISSPACVSSAISVGATTDSDTVASYSNSASFLNLLAPGSNIKSSVPGGSYQSWNGTSMATPHVTGSWALLKQANPSASVDLILNALTSTGVGITDTRNNIIKPRIQVDSALAVLEGIGIGKPNILWRNSATGENLVWRMNNGQYAGYVRLRTAVSLNWSIVGTGDFNGDGQTDIVWRNTSSGSNAIWYMNGTQYLGYAMLPVVANQTWAIAGTGDFNGDSHLDILWRNSVTGENLVWYMNGAQYLGHEFLPTASSPNWSIAGAGNFNGDSNPDILWRNTLTGENVVWYMNGVQYVGYVKFPTVGNQNWKIVGR